MKEVFESKTMLAFILFLVGVTFVNSLHIRLENEKIERDNNTNILASSNK